ncbi:MAG: 16S rRNA (uracil(1498)-N(3))-methyltransferase [Muribaculaceae bacterium]|nr:16S rRNA (uracil(1498)-N(3))-methyltransferase [Muribaculaceae bacterium]
MIRFYSPDIETTGVLPEIESGHCCRVLRMKEGDIIYVVDGLGHEFECEITDAHPKHTALKIISSKEEPKHWKERIVLAVAPTKNIDRIEWMLEKVVEIGVDEIVLLKCDHSERRNINEERLLKIIISAMKQSLKATLPVFKGLIPFREYMDSIDTEGRYMGYCDSETERCDFATSYPGNRNLTILIGPEGDFSPEEVKLAISNGFIPVTFGESRLRTESAALFAVTATHVIDKVKGNDQKEHP